METVIDGIKVKKYPDYKDSGVEWIGEIPSHWKVIRLKYIFRILKRISGELGHNVLSITQTGIKVKDTESGEGQLSMDYSKYQIVKKGDFAMNHMDLLTGYVDISKYDGVISPDYRVFELADSISFKSYMLLLLQLGYRSKIFYAHGQGVSMLGRWRFPTENFNAFLFPIPPKEEQTSIATFLDCKTALIDKAIDIKQKQIELLKERRQILIHKAVTRGLNPNVKMKDSGVEWIGAIPEGWDKSHLKWMSKLFAGGTPDKANLKYWENGTIPWIASGEVNQEIVKYPTTYITNIGYKNSSARWIEKDSLIVALAGQGKTKGMVAYLDISTTGNQSLAAVIPNKERIFAKYLFFYLMAAYKELRGVSGEGQRDGLNLQKLGDIDICIPSIEEQINISVFIETASKKIFDTISLKEQEIEKLKEYKATLINSAVTGKIKVC